MNIKKKGFTLIEILVVATIIGLLAGAGAVSYSSLVKSSRDARRKADLEQIRAALEMYRSSNNTYPSTSSAWWGACSGYGSKPDTGATGYVPNLAPQYIPKLPHDPKEGISNGGCGGGGGASCYLYKSDGTDFKLLAHCTVEVAASSSDPYYDSVRAGSTYQISSSQTSLSW